MVGERSGGRAVKRRRRRRKRRTYQEDALPVFFFAGDCCFLLDADMLTCHYLVGESGYPRVSEDIVYARFRGEREG